MPEVLDAPAACGEQRQAHRFPVVEERQATLVEIRRRRFEARIVDESASGLQIVVTAPIELTLAMQVLVYAGDAWLPAEVVRSEIRTGETIVGLRRLEETFDPDAVSTRDFQLRDLMPAGIFFWLVALALVALVVLVVISPTPEPAPRAVRPSSRPLGASSTSVGRSTMRSSRTVSGSSSPSRSTRPSAASRPTPSVTPRSNPVVEPAGASSAVAASPADRRSSGSSAVRQSNLGVLADPQVATELGLSDEQRRALEELERQTPADQLPAAALEVLTPAQREQLRQRQAAATATP
ncbi:MAG: PilZ domain-containing protein [Pirellulales bacterium]